VILSSRPEAGTPQSSLGPTPANERIESLDVLRGLALFMILTANMAGFYSPLYYLDEAARHFGRPAPIASLTLSFLRLFKTSL